MTCSGVFCSPSSECQAALVYMADSTNSDLFNVNVLAGKMMFGHMSGDGLCFLCSPFLLCFLLPSFLWCQKSSQVRLFSCGLKMASLWISGVSSLAKRKEKKCSQWLVMIQFCHAELELAAPPPFRAIFRQMLWQPSVSLAPSLDECR